MAIKPPSRSFINGFLLTAAVLFSLNIASYVLLRLRMPDENDGSHFDGTAGYPLPFYEHNTGCFSGFDGFLTAGIVVDYVFVLAVAVAVGARCHLLGCKR